MSWQRLPVELKKDIVGLLDYESRCHLRTCSKSDKDIVDTAKIHVEKLKIEETSSEMSEGKTIIRIDIDTFTIWFIGKENLTRIDRGWNGEIIDGFSDIKQRNRYELIGEFLDKLNIDKVESVEVTGLYFPPPPSWNIKPNNLDIRFNEQDQNMIWLKKCLGPTIKKLIFMVNGDYEEITELIIKTKITESLRLQVETQLTDEQLEGIEAPDMIISSSNITTNGAKKILEKFLKYGKQADQLTIYLSLPDKFNALEQIIPKTLILKREKHEDEEEGEFFGEIISGFDNIHGLQDPREIECDIVFGRLVWIHCKIHEKTEKILMDPKIDRF